MRGVIVVVAFVSGLAVVIGIVALTIASVVPTCVSCIASERAPFMVGAEARGPSLAVATADVKNFDVDIPTTTTHGPRALHATLSIPARSDTNRAPAAILLHGSGAANRNGDSPGDVVRTYDAPFPVLTRIADVLTARGIIVLRWDKRACAPCYAGESLDVEQFTYDDLVADARDALTYLRTNEHVDPSRLLVLGHSEGGGLALELANDPGVVGVVSLSGLLEGFDTGLVRQFDRAALVRAQQADLFGAFGIMLSGRTYARCFAEPIPDDLDESCVGGHVTNRALRAYVESSRRAADRLRAANVPVLALMGNVDRNVDPDVFATLAEARLNKRVQWRYIANADHALTDVTKDPPALHADVVSTLDAWLTGPQSRSVLDDK